MIWRQRETQKPYTIWVMMRAAGGGVLDGRGCWLISPSRGMKERQGWNLEGRL
jgi:hypothetical protein